LTTRTLGVLGVGGIGQQFLRMAKPFGWRMLGSDPHVDAATMSALGAEKVSPETFAGAERSFVGVFMILNEQTRHFLNAERLAFMPKHAYLIDMARGPVIDEVALIKVLQNNHIAGASTGCV
jgi:D-3-phosphoglycerate dehydrogenase